MSAVKHFPWVKQTRKNLRWVDDALGFCVAEIPEDADGEPQEDVATLISVAPELLMALAESTGMLHGMMDILEGGRRPSSAAAEQLRAQHAKCLALLRRAAPPEPKS